MMPAELCAADVCSYVLAAVVDHVRRHPELADAAQPIMLATARTLVQRLQGEPPAIVAGNVLKFKRKEQRQ